MEMPPALASLDYLAVQQLHASTSQHQPDYASTLLEARENVITLVDSSGREFHTNLHATDLEHLMKYNILSGLREQLRSQKRRQVTESVHGGSKTDALLGRKSQSANGTHPLERLDNSYADSSTPTVNGKAGRLPVGGVKNGNGKVKRSRNAIMEDLRGKPVLELLDDPMVQNFQEHHSPAETAEKKTQSRKKLKAARKLAKLAPAGDKRMTHQNKGNRGKRCRKVYGTERRDLWCRQCKWKKSCGRFGIDGKEEEGEEDAPPSGVPPSAVAVKPLPRPPVRTPERTPIRTPVRTLIPGVPSQPKLPDSTLLVQALLAP